jgi:hypothetical protein
MTRVRTAQQPGDTAVRRDQQMNEEEDATDALVGKAVKLVAPLLERMKRAQRRRFTCSADA